MPTLVICMMSPIFAIPPPPDDYGGRLGGCLEYVFIEIFASIRRLSGDPLNEFIWWGPSLTNFSEVGPDEHFLHLSTYNIQHD